MSRLIHLVLFLSLLLSACGPAVSPTPVTVATSPHSPTPTPAPTLTLAPTATLPSGPKVTGHLPAYSHITARQPNLTLKFDRAMNPDSVLRAIRLTPTVPISVVWESEVTAMIHILEALTPGEAFTLTVDTSATDVAGLALDQAYTWGYTISPFTAETYRASTARPTEALNLYFNYPVDPESAVQAFTITPALTGIWVWKLAHTSASFTPATFFASNTTYTVSFDGGPLKDFAGNPLPSPAPIRFTTPPPAITFMNDAHRMSPGEDLRLAFDRPMNQASVEAAFVLSPTMRGEFVWANNQLSFAPEAGYFAENTAYTLHLQPTLTDAGGEALLTEARAWSFETGQLPDVVSFGYGPNAQVIDADGPRAIQFRVHEREAAVVTFDLYRLNQAQFINRYNTGFRVRQDQWQTPPTIDAQSLVLQHSWQMDVSDAARQVTWENNRPQTTTLPADLAPGLYLLNLTGQHLNDQLFVLVTHYALAIKQGEGEILAWVNAVNGQPAPEVEVTAFHASGTSLAHCRTNASGVCRLPLGAATPLLVFAGVGDDVAMAGLSGGWNSPQGYASASQPAAYAVNVYTDRPIYRPGQTVYFNALIRQNEDAILSAPPVGATLTARLRDSRGNIVRTIYLTTDEFGAASSLFRIAEGAMLGDYAVEVVMNGESHRQTFKVQEYVKPDYAVSLTTDAPSYVAGDTLQASVDASYFYGEPVVNARVTVKQYALGYNYYCWDACEEAWTELYGSDFTGRTDADGRFTFTLETDTGRRGVEVTVDDGSHQTVSAFVVVKVFSTDALLQLDTGGYFKAPGQTFTLSAGARSILDEPLSDRSLRVQVRRWNTTTYDYTTVIQTLNLTTDATGQATTPVTIAEPGYYQIRLTGSDRRGHALEQTTWLYVFDGATLWTRDTTQNDLRVAVDRATYAPGETATLLIESTMSGPALLTVERGTVRREQLIQLTAPLTRLPLTLQPDDAPNIFVSVMAWMTPTRQPDEQLNQNDYRPGYYQSVADSQLRLARVQLNVPPLNKALTLTLTPDKDRYAPREAATFHIHVTDALGQPVAAQVSLALVDEAIFSLSDDLSTALTDTFYAPRPLGVSTYDSFAPSRITGGYYCFGWCCECGGGGDGGGALGMTPRNNFPDTAYWEPDVRTDAQGEATITLRLPDNLTSWRLTAKAITVDTQVGETYLNLSTHQEIVVRPLLPRTLILSDTVDLSAIVHNYGDETRSLIVSLASDQLAVVGDVTRTLTLAPDEQGLVGWSAIAATLGEAKITITAYALALYPDEVEVGDAVQSSIPIQPLAIPDLTVQVGEFTGEFGMRLTLPAEALDLSTVKIELSRSIAGSMLSGLEYLTGYPYGCVEQTMSKALPNAVVARAFHQLGLSDHLQSDLPLKINASLQRLYGFQHDEGGWGWWHDDATDDYQTAWVVFGLSVTKEAGYEVDGEVIRRGADYLASRLDQMDVRTRAFALYSLARAGQGNLPATQLLAKQAKALDPFSQAALALALHQLGAATEAQRLLALLVASAQVDNGLVHWATGVEDGHYHDKTMSSDTRSTALALSALVAIAPEHELEAGVVRWLMSQRRADGWGSTNETSFTILALTDHLLAKESAGANTTYGVELNGALVAEGAVGHTQPMATIVLSAEQMATGINYLRLTQTGGGRLYYTIRQQTYVAQPEIPAGGRVTVSRRYLDAQGQPLTGTVNAGDLVRVSLTVNMPQAGFYMLVEDKLPGGLEALNEGLNTTSHDGHPANYYEYSGGSFYRWEALGYNNKEVRVDRVSFFITELSAGAHTFTYLARATRAGTFTALPVEVSAMYDAQLWGRSTSARLVVVELAE